MIKLAIMISGRGSNMLALVDAIDALNLPAIITRVISNQPCAGIDNAAARGLPVEVIRRGAFDSRQDHDSAMARAIDGSGADFVFLAGYMAILGPAFVEHYAGSLINIHPSLLPAYKGLDTHQRALDDGTTEHGATVHLVTAELDAGPIIAQAGLAVVPQESAQSLAARVLVLEHQLYPFVLASLAMGRLRLSSAGPLWPDRDAALAAMPEDMQNILAPALINLS